MPEISDDAKRNRDDWTQANAEEATLHGLLREVLMERIELASARAQRLGVGHLIPQGFDHWFAQCVDREPSHRPPNAAQALQASSRGAATKEGERTLLDPGCPRCPLGGDGPARGRRRGWRGFLSQSKRERDRSDEQRCRGRGRR